MPIKYYIEPAYAPLDNINLLYAQLETGAFKGNAAALNELGALPGEGWISFNNVDVKQLKPVSEAVVKVFWPNCRNVLLKEVNINK